MDEPIEMCNCCWRKGEGGTSGEKNTKLVTFISLKIFQIEVCFNRLFSRGLMVKSNFDSQKFLFDKMINSVKEVKQEGQ